MSAKTKSQTKIWRSLCKYGPKAHSFKIIEICELSELNQKERYYQIYYDSVKNGLNCIYTDYDGPKGPYCPETRKRMSESKKEYYKNNRHPWTGRKHKQSTKDKISKANRGRRYSHKINSKKSSHASYSKNNPPPSKGVFGAKNHASKAVIMLENGVPNKIFPTIGEAANFVDGFPGNISSACGGKLKTAYGKEWKYF